MKTGTLAIGAGLLLASAGQAADVPTGRLPADAAPVAYRLDLREDPRQPRFRGHVEIDIQFNQAARDWWINGRGLHVSHVEVRSAGRTVPATYTEAGTTGIAHCNRP